MVQTASRHGGCGRHRHRSSDSSHGSPDPVRHAVPKAFVALTPGRVPSRELAADILTYCRTRLASYKRIRRIEFIDLPKTVSGKIRRVELRALERERRASGERAAQEFFEEDLSS